MVAEYVYIFAPIAWNGHETMQQSLVNVTNLRVIKHRIGKGARCPASGITPFESTVYSCILLLQRHTVQAKISLLTSAHHFLATEGLTNPTVETQRQRHLRRSPLRLPIHPPRLHQERRKTRFPQISWPRESQRTLRGVLQESGRAV